MESLKKMSNARLKSVAKAAQAEIDRREAVAKKALDEIEVVLNRYGVDLTDLTNTGSSKPKVKKRASTKRSQRKSNTSSKSAKVGSRKKADLDKRSAVKPKYKNPKSSETWSGRGKSPKWVLAICETEKLSISEFKADQRFTKI